jgi:hypothetical protein
MSEPQSTEGGFEEIRLEPPDLPSEPMQGPAVDGAWLREHVERVREADARAVEEREAESTAQLLATIRETAEREIAAWRALPCLGEVEHADKCSDEFAAACAHREDYRCPRRAAAQKKRQEERRLDTEYSRFAGLGIPEHILDLFYDGKLRETESFTRLRAIWPEFDEPQPPLRLNERRRRPPARPTIVVLSGGIGTGKSCAAAVWAMRRQARFLTADAFARLSPYTAAWDEYANWPAIVLDDLGREYLDPRGFFQSSLDSLVDRRYARALDLLITTNLRGKRRNPERPASPEDPPQFAERCGARVVDRIREVGKFLTIAGPSLRPRRVS